MHVQYHPPFFTEMLLLEKLGPAPTIAKVARFLEEAPSTTWRRLNDGYLQEVGGEGITRITLKSLAALLNGSRPHVVTYKRGKLPGEKKPGRRDWREAEMKRTRQREEEVQEHAEARAREAASAK